MTTAHVCVSIFLLEALSFGGCFSSMVAEELANRSIIFCSCNFSYLVEIFIACSWYPSYAAGNGL